ncbi:MAG: AI-2E family transporter [Candidatus Curtissbacteria bacterium]|nr:AI-2E family transporter [Candidatus Curtissbacteria bacterium]
MNFEEIKKEVNLIRVLAFLGIIYLGFHLLGIVWTILGQFADIFLILVLAWLLSFILEPVVTKIKRWFHLSRLASTLIAYLFLSLAFATMIFLLVPIVTVQIQNLIAIIPAHLESAPAIINRYSDTLLGSLNNSLSLIPSVAQFLFSTFIVLILSFYFIIDKDKINKEIFALTPKKWHDEVVFLQNVIENSFASFLRVQLIFGIISGILTWIVLRALNIDFAASAALLAGILTIIPLLGPILGIIPPVVVAFIAGTNEALIVFVVLLIAQQFIFNVLGPKLFSKALKLSPIIILISFLVGLRVAGGVGAIFAVPVLGILAVVIGEISRRYLKRGQE